ncbi:hypothetical protein TUBRATIS_12150 [Tubulinosema ratisbonensis]|uniref:Uncharacterized protein n=1 Tax=Tubulinosema ratisbonensis TaxID=291195 RepID=A0A437AMG0_9MICR|nr:hypothetical protein TUBRATIS_12150 [Tubulinosema ratisbonensis]
MKEPAQSYDRNTYKVIKKEQTNNPIKHLVKTHEGLYTFCKKYVYLNNKKVAKFTGKITQIINQSDLLICADKNGSIKVINKRVIKRFELGKEIKSLCSINDKIFVVDNESTFYVFSLFENDFIFKKSFKNILSLQCDDNKVILCTKKELIFLNEEFKKIKSFKMKNKKNKLF